MTWQWITNQVFAFVGLVFVVISYQQKDSKRLLIYRNLATLFIFIGLCFLGNVSAIIFCGTGIIRNLISLYFAYKPNAKTILKYTSSSILILLIILLNLIYWKNYFNLFSIVIGILAIIALMQKKAFTIRKISVIGEILAIIYYALLLSPGNVIIELVGLISAIIGIIRVDLKKEGNDISISK